MTELLIQDFVLSALLAGIILSIPLGILGCFTLWKRMTFFGDAMGHAAIFGVAGGLLFSSSPAIGVLISSIGAVLILSRHRESSILPMDTWLGIVSYGGLAAGLIIITLNPQLRVNPETVLFGEIFATTHDDILLITLCSIVTIMTIWLKWRSLLLVSINEDLAKTTGVNVTACKTIIFSLMALTTAVSVKIVGGLMLPALLIFPAASVTRSATPETMVAKAIISALIIFILGFLSSLYFDLPCAPCLVLVGITILILNKLTSFK